MLHNKIGFSALTVVMLAFASSASAGEADIVQAVAHKAGDTYSFDVTIKSNERGWDYYADAFEILSPDGKVLATRVLDHPHVDEQPFTRSLAGVRLPAGTTVVIVRAHHKPAGYNGSVLTLSLPR